MAVTLKPRYIYRPIYYALRCYSDENKSIYQRDEEGPKPRSVYGMPYPDWRKPWIERDGEWKSKLSLFVEKNPSAHVLNAMQKIPNLDVDTVKYWWSDLKVTQQEQNQKYLPERVATLGSNLAAVHFFCYRNAGVRLKDSMDWLAGLNAIEGLPRHFMDNIFVDSIDCENFHHGGIRYEGLQNLTGLNFLKGLVLKNNKHVDAWCLDRIAGLVGQTLEYLNIEGCDLCLGGVVAISRMSTLKYLAITEPGNNFEVQAAISELEQVKPSLLIKCVPPEKVETIE